MLQEKSVAAENSCAERLLEGYSDLNLWRGAEESLTVNHVLVAGCDFYRNDVPWKLGSECQFAGETHSAVFRHENRPAARDALDHAEESAATGELRVRSHLDGGAHPRKLSGFGDDGFVGLQDEFQNRHRGASDAALHVGLL